MTVLRRILSAVLFLVSPMSLASGMEVAYKCQSSQPTSFSSGDQVVGARLVREIQWSLAEPANMNLVVGERKGLIWVRRPWGSQERFLTVLRHVPGQGYVQDSTEVPMGQMGEDVTREVRFSFVDPVMGSTQVVCSVRMEK